MWVSSANTECSHWGPAGSCINSLSAARLQCHAGGDIVLGWKHINWMDSGYPTGCIKFPNVRHKQSQNSWPKNTISVENICSSGTISPPAAMKGSLSANQQTQENNGPVSRVPACLVPRVQAQCCLTQSLPTDDGRKIVWGLGFKAQIFSCALLRMLKTIFTLETENVLSRKLYKYFHYAGKYFSNN